MNKRRNKERRMSFPEVLLLILAAVVLMAAGVTHAWLKNSHVEVIRDVDKTQQQISDHEDSINSLQVKIDKKLNIYQLRDDLERAHSKLVTVPVSSLEKIPLHQFGEVADARGDPSRISQRRP